MQQDRVTLKALIDSYITTNGNKDITGAQLNEVLTNLNDSAFLQLDELRTALSTSYNPANPLNWNAVPSEVKAALDEAISRVEGLENAGFQTAAQTSYNLTVPSDWDGTPNELQGSTDELASRVRTIENEPNQTAFETPYSPANAAEWNPEEPLGPTEVKRGLDILAARTGVNPSDNVAYVSNTGINPGVTPQVGNPLKPYTTIQDGLNAVGSYGRVIVAPGTYTENITSNNVIGLSLIMNGVILNGNATIFAGASGFKYIEMYGSTINGTFRLDNGYLKGGLVNGQCQFFSADVYDLIINNTGGFGMSGGNTNKFFNCEITGSSIAVRRTTNSEFHNCVISGTSAWEDNFSTSTVFDNCDLISTGQTIIGANQVVKALIHNCNIKSDTAENIAFALDSNELKVTNSNFSSPTSNLLINQTSLNRTINEQTVFESCFFVAGTGAILVEPASYTTDAGTTLFINCTINKAAVTNVAPIRVTEHNTFSYLNLQDFA